MSVIFSSGNNLLDVNFVVLRMSTRFQLCQCCAQVIEGIMPAHHWMIPCRLTLPNTNMHFSALVSSSQTLWQASKQSAGMEQSRPSQPSQHPHLPFMHKPLASQSLGQRGSVHCGPTLVSSAQTISLQSGPRKPTLQAHFPSKQRPLPVQSFGHFFRLS